jgi:D-amino-acid dehydrogenase
LTQAAVTSRLVADLIEGRTSEIDPTPYSAQRFR